MKRPHEQVRLNNLEILIAEAGSAAKVAQLAGTSESYLSQVRRKMRTQKGTPRGLGDELATKLEKGLGKPSGWMDEPHEIASLDADTQQSVRVRNPMIYMGGETAAVELSSQHLPLKDHYPTDTTHQKSASKIKSEAGADIIILCPLISWEQACEVAESIKPFDQRDAEEILPCPVPCSQGSFILRVKGASMEPKFHNGDLIFVDPNADPESGKYVVIQSQDSDEATFKQLIIEGGQKYLKALNPDWPERIVESSDTTRVCGVVVFKGVKM